MNLIETIDRHRQYTDSVAHIYRRSIMKYGELADKSDALASYLIAEYGCDKTPVIVYGHKQHEMLICFLACIKAGHAYIPVDSSLPTERINAIIEDSGAKVLLNIGGFNWDDRNVKIIDLSLIKELIAKYINNKPDKAFFVKDDDNFYIIYTSGSTGKPKGVQVTLSCLISFVKWGLRLCRIDNEHNDNLVILNQAPFSFDLSVMDLYIALVSGATLYSIDNEMIINARELFDHLKVSGINVWVSTPSFAEMCLADRSFSNCLLPELKLFLFCGETLVNDCVRKLLERFGDEVRIVNLYGPTEATVAVTAIDIDRELCEKAGPIPLGYAKDECQILIMDDDGNVMPDGVCGEIVIVGESVSPGYFRNEEISARAFGKIIVNGSEARCYRTGDIGYLNHRILYFGGRKDSQIKLAGYRMEIEDIENNLRKIEIIKNAVVLPVMKDNRVRYLTAVILLNRSFNESEFEIGLIIKKRLRQLVPRYMVPRKIIIRDALPMTVNGKLDRNKLVEMLK
jgi:D-alanine--poly(phosphoribitol) ligase subunit 1